MCRIYTKSGKEGEAKAAVVEQTKYNCRFRTGSVAEIGGDDFGWRAVTLTVTLAACAGLRKIITYQQSRDSI
jgi:hypothetical protein